MRSARADSGVIPGFMRPMISSHPTERLSTYSGTPWAIVTHMSTSGGYANPAGATPVTMNARPSSVSD